MAEKDEQIIELKEKIGGLKEETTKMEAETFVKKLKSSIHLQALLPVELLNEMLSSMPLGNVIKLLAKMPNGLLARNAQKMINRIKMTLKGNEWNEADCGQKLTVSENGLVATHSGPNGKNSVYAKLPLPSFNLGTTKASILFYIEMEILKKPCDDFISLIGTFCKQLPSEKQIIAEYISAGGRNEPIVVVDGNDENETNLNEGDVTGFGILHRPNSTIKCFSTCNGKLREKSEFSPLFSKLLLFPILFLYNDGTSIRANFGKAEWRFKQFKQVLEEEE